MNIENISGLQQPIGPSAMTVRPSGEDQKTERVPNADAPENVRAINKKDDQGTMIDIMA